MCRYLTVHRVVQNFSIHQDRSIRTVQYRTIQKSLSFNFFQKIDKMMLRAYGTVPKYFR